MSPRMCYGVNLENLPLKIILLSNRNRNNRSAPKNLTDAPSIVASDAPPEKVKYHSSGLNIL